MGYECIRGPMLLPLWLPRWNSITNCSGSFTGSFRSRIWSISVKIAVLAPIPRASDKMATAANSGLRRRPRRARRRSGHKEVIVVVGRIDLAKRLLSADPRTVMLIY